MTRIPAADEERIPPVGKREGTGFCIRDGRRWLGGAKIEQDRYGMEEEVGR